MIAVQYNGNKLLIDSKYHLITAISNKQEKKHKTEKFTEEVEKPHVFTGNRKLFYTYILTISKHNLYHISDSNSPVRDIEKTPPLIPLKRIEIGEDLYLATYHLKI